MLHFRTSNVVHVCGADGMGRKLKGGGHVPKDVHSLLPLLNTTSSKKGGDYKVLVPRAHALCVALTLCRDLSNKREYEASSHGP
jgi:hypothetical protein